MRTLLFVLGAALALFAGCGGDDEGQPQVDGVRVLQQAKDAVAAASSFHFRLDHENGTTPMPLGLPFQAQLVSAEGDVAKPDRLFADVRARASNLSAGLKVIGVGDRTWITNLFSGDWQPLSGASVKDIADPTALVAAVVAQLRDVQVPGRERVDGVECYHITGTLDAGALAGALPSVQAGRQLKVDVWIGQADSLPRRVHLTGPIADGEAENVVRRLDLSRFNEPVNIQPPA